MGGEGTHGSIIIWMWRHDDNNVTVLIHYIPEEGWGSGLVSASGSGNNVIMMSMSLFIRFQKRGGRDGGRLARSSGSSGSGSMIMLMKISLI